jgi:2,4-dienoyl-CoA reductase-like NADH-dependent reductase (Old Yellow Enzyme family)
VITFSVQHVVGDEGMSKLFESTEMKGMMLPNRFVRSATWEGMATEEGACTRKLIDLMVVLAQGGVGLIMTSHAYVRRDGQAGPFQLGVYDDHLIKGLAEMARAVHDRGGHIALQLAHAGLFADLSLTHEAPVAFSEVEGFGAGPRKVMTVQDIQEIVAAFGRAAHRAKKAGFDGVQIHAAHGYLLSQGLSPAFNKRSDGYGGPLENRARALVEVLHAVRQAVGEDYPVLVKMNSQDFLDGGLSLEESVKAAALLQENGIDAIEISGGTTASRQYGPARTGIKGEDQEAYFREAAQAFKRKVQVPILLVGGIRSFELAERLVTDGVCDYISMSRPLIREPDLIKRWASGDRSKARCLSDNQCYGPARAGEGVHCVVEKQERKRTERQVRD